MKNIFRFLSVIAILICTTLTSVSANDDLIIHTAETDFEITQCSVMETPGISHDELIELRELFYEAINNFEPSVSLYDMNIDYSLAKSVHAAFFNLVFDTPQFFYVDFVTGISIRYTQSGILYDIGINYTYTSKEELKPRMDAFKHTSKNIINEMYTHGVKSGFDKAMWLHDYIATHCTYDLTYEKHGADYALIEQTAVCQGYAGAYKYLLNLVGIECEEAYDNTDEHEWSMAKLDGKWYHIDVTYDDPVYDFMGNVSHEYFGLTDDEIHEKEGHSEWYTSVDEHICNDDRYKNAPWKKSSSSIVFSDDDRYFIDDNTSYIVKCDKDFNVTDSQFFKIDGKWYTKDSSQYEWRGIFSGLSTYNNFLFFNTSTQILKLNPKTKDVSVYYTYVPKTDHIPSGAYIFGSCIKNGEVYLAEVNYKDVYFGDELYKDYVAGTSTDNIDSCVLTPFKIIFDTDSTDFINAQYVDKNKKLKKPDCSKDGYELVGWFTDPYFENEWSFDDGVSKSMTLYAKWAEAEADVSVDDSIAHDTESDTIKGTVEINVPSEIEEPELYLAIYKNGLLQYIKQHSGNHKKFENISTPYEPGNDYTYKVFVWNDFHAPYFDAKFKQIN